jgi:hypothetical protein
MAMPVTGRNTPEWEKNATIISGFMITIISEEECARSFFWAKRFFFLPTNVLHNVQAHHKLEKYVY